MRPVVHPDWPDAPKPPAAAAGVSPRNLLDWMMKFQFDGEVDYFQGDPVAYAPTLGAAGIASYCSKLDARRRSLGSKPFRRARTDCRVKIEPIDRGRNYAGGE